MKLKFQYSALVVLSLSFALVAGACHSTPDSGMPPVEAQASAPVVAPAGLPPMGAAGQMPGGGLMPGGGPSSVDTSAIARKWLDVPYATTSATQKLDIFLPDAGVGPFPVIISIHGGAFKLGNRKSGELAPMLAGRARGYAVVSVDYRLSGEARFPAAVHDLKAAVRFIRLHSGEYSLDAARIVAWGGSAGGNLAAMLGTSAGDAYLEGTEGQTGASSSVQAVVDWYGPISFSTMDAEFKALGVTPKMGATSIATSPESEYIGKTVGTPEAEPLVRLASPASYIDPTDPPFYIQHGTVDTNVPLTQSVNFAGSLAASIGAGKVMVEKLEGAGHGGSDFNADANLEKIYAFLGAALNR